MSPTFPQKMTSSVCSPPWINPPDILVNNAGYLPQPALFPEADLGEWWRGFTVNVLGTAQMTQSYILHRRSRLAAGAKPAVVVRSQHHRCALHSGSAALRLWREQGRAGALSELMTADIPATEARFVSVHPGAVETEMFDKSGLSGVFPATDGQLVGDFITWLTSDEASFLAGRFAWVNWDIDELLRKKDEILAKDLLRTSLSE